MSSANNSISTARRLSGLATKYRRVRRASLELVGPLAPEDTVVQTMAEVSPTKWHLAHVTWFFEKFCLNEHQPGYRNYDERFHYLFNSYYYSVGEMHSRPRRGLLSRPTLREVRAYRERVDYAMLELIDSRAGDPELEFIVTLGLHHEQQHQELMLTDIKHVFFTNPLAPSFTEPRQRPSGAAVAFEFVDRPGGRFEIGADGSEFCFDNETPRHPVLIGAHALGNRLVTNSEYREFIDDGGYKNPALWLSDGWAISSSESWSHPLYWSDDLETEFTLHGWQAIEPDCPVTHLSHYEADAFARWAGARLPSEAEWELAAADSKAVGNTLDTRHLHPVRAVAGDPAPGGLYQLWGDVWEWTASPYVAYPSFKPLAGSLGEYNGKFMSNQIVVRGGSCATWRDHIRATYRSFFYPRDRWQFLGLRLAKDA